MLYRLRQQLLALLTCQIFLPTNGGISPGVIASVCNAPILPHPDQPVGTVIELSLPCQTLPVSVAIGCIRHHFGFGLTRILLFDLLARGRQRCCKTHIRSALLTMSLATVAVRSVRIVADPDEAVSSVARVDEAVGTGPKDGLVVVASVQLIEMVAVLFVRQGSLLLLTVGLIESVNGGRRSLLLRPSPVTID